MLALVSPMNGIEGYNIINTCYNLEKPEKPNLNRKKKNLKKPTYKILLVRTIWNVEIYIVDH